MTTGTNPLIDISGTGTLISALDNSDDGTAAFTYSFPITFFGNVRNAITISSNGIVVLDPNGVTPSFTPAAIPTATTPNDMVCPLWMDLYNFTTQTGGHIYLRQDALPDRLIVEWKNVSTRTSTTVTPDNFTFETIFNQNDGSVEIRYGTMTTSATTPAITATAPTIGIESQSGTLGPTANPISGFAALAGTSYLFRPAPVVYGTSSPNPAASGQTVTLFANVFSC